MTPISKIIQIMQVMPDHRLLVLCSDGSVWWMDVSGNNVGFTLVSQIVKGAYQ